MKKHKKQALGTLFTPTPSPRSPSSSESAALPPLEHAGSVGHGENGEEEVDGFEKDSDIEPDDDITNLVHHHDASPNRVLFGSSDEPIDGRSDQVPIVIDGYIQSHGLSLTDMNDKLWIVREYSESASRWRVEEIVSSIIRWMKPSNMQPLLDGSRLLLPFLKHDIVVQNKPYSIRAMPQSTRACIVKTRDEDTKKQFGMVSEVLVGNDIVRAFRLSVCIMEALKEDVENHSLEMKKEEFYKYRRHILDEQRASIES